MVFTEGDEGRVTFLGMWPGHLYRVPHSEGLHAWFYSLPVAVLKFLIPSPLNSCFVSDDWWEMGHIHEQRSYLQFASPTPFLAIPLSYGLLDALWEQNPTTAVPHGSSVRLTEYQASVMSAVESAGGAGSPERPHFLFEPEPASNAERRQWCSRKIKQPRKLSY